MDSLVNLNRGFSHGASLPMSASARRLGPAVSGLAPAAAAAAAAGLQVQLELRRDSAGSARRGAAGRRVTVNLTRIPGRGRRRVRVAGLGPRAAAAARALQDATEYVMVV